MSAAPHAGLPRRTPVRRAPVGAGRPDTGGSLMDVRDDPAAHRLAVLADRLPAPAEAAT